MTVPSLKKFSKSFKYVDKTYGLFRTGTYKGALLTSQIGPKQCLLGGIGDTCSRNFSQASSLQKGLVRSLVDPTLFKRFSELESKVDVLKSRDFMKLTGVSSSPNLTPTVDSGATFYFDTHKLVTTLQSHGFSLDQAETITDCLTEILTNGASGMSKYMVSI